jgi:hypothetical protein
VKLADFPEVWFASFEYDRRSGENPQPTRFEAWESRSGSSIVMDGHRLSSTGTAPIPAVDDALIVTYDAPALLGCFLSLGWSLPSFILDLHAEYRCLCSGLIDTKDLSLSLALEALRSDPTGSHIQQLLALYDTMLPYLDLDNALSRGRYTRAVAHMEHVGIPLDRKFLDHLRVQWKRLRPQLIKEVDRQYGVFDGMSFREEHWDHWVEKQGIMWPRLKSGRLALDDSTFKDMARVHPGEVRPMWELRKTLRRLKLDHLAVGHDGRNRTSLRPFASKTGRNQPSTNRFIFGSAAWVRSLIKPERGMGLAYVDYEQQEFGIAAALSGDPAMMEAYCTGDPYLSFAKQARAAPPEATKASHPAIRDQYKLCCIGIQYGIRPRSLALRINGTVAEAAQLISDHRKVFSKYWQWSQENRRAAREIGLMRTISGWNLNVHAGTKEGTLLNFALQATGADMLRLACSMLIERGIVVCAPVHDAVLIEAPVEELDAVVAECQDILTQASGIILNGFRLRTEVQEVRYPDRLMDPRGKRVWGWLCEKLGSPDALVKAGDFSTN